LHTLVASRSKAILQVLEEQASGMIAQHAESLHGGDCGKTENTVEA